MTETGYPTLIAIHGHEVRALEHAGEAFEHEFRRDFYRSLLNGVKRGALQKLMVVALAAGAVVHSRAQTSGRVDVVLLLDLSRSVAAKGHDSKAEFQKNVQGVTTILGTLPAGARVNVVGITDDSFASPYIILSGELTSDPGYFNERLANGRATLVRAWQARSARLAPHYVQTDLLGALLVASDVFHESPRGGRKVLVVFSDMRQATQTLNLEHQAMVCTKAALQRVANNKLFADLHGVDVYAKGVDAAGETVGYWQSLHDFWMAYLTRAGATVARYSILRDVPEFAATNPTGVDGRAK